MKGSGILLLIALAVAVGADADPPRCEDVGDDVLCTPRGSGGGGTKKSPTWCAYDCEGVPQPIEIELPPGMFQCPGGGMRKVRYEALKGFRPSCRIRTPRAP
jgi:hypothetical protein